MKNENYITIQGWMVNELKLTGNDLICYALIYGFTQNGDYWDKSSSYMCGWLGVSKRSVLEILKRLTDTGCIERKEFVVNGVKFCKYRASATNFTSGEESSPRGGEESSPHINNIYNKEKEEIDKSISKKDELFDMFEAFIIEYKKLYGKHTGGSAKTLFNEFTKRHKDWEKVIPLLMDALYREYAQRDKAKQNNEFFPNPKLLSTYLGKQRAWEAWSDETTNLFGDNHAIDNTQTIFDGQIYK